MKIKNRMWLLLLFLTLSISALPISAQARHHHHHYYHCYHWCYGGNGLMYDTKDGMFYPVPSAQHYMIYRSVDGKYYPVKRYGYHCYYRHHHRHCHYHFVSVICKIRPNHWTGAVWFPKSKVCWYK